MPQRNSLRYSVSGIETQTRQKFVVRVMYTVFQNESRRSALVQHTKIFLGSHLKIKKSKNDTDR